MYNYASILAKKGDLVEAEIQARHSLEGHVSLGQTTIGRHPEHMKTNVKHCVAQLAGILCAQGKDEEAVVVEQTYNRYKN